MSCSSPDFKPFSSGCGMCKPLTNYYSQTQTGGGNYSEDGLIPKSNGKNFYKPVDYSLPLDNKFSKNNFGIDYATANGGVKKSKKSKSKSKKIMSGGLDMANKGDIKGLSTGDYALFSSGGAKGKKDKKKSLKGGFVGMMNHSKSMMNYSKSMNDMQGEEMHHTPGEEMHYKQSGGKKNKKLMSGGLDMANTGDIKGLSTGDYALFSSSGGTKGKKDKKKSLKGGFVGMMNNSKSMHHIPGEEMHHTPGEEMHYKQSGGKKTKKSMSGGMESSGATSLPMRFYNPDTPLDNYPELSGNGSMSAYGAIESGDIGTGMLAPYTASTCQTANPSSGMKTGGGKKSKKSMKGGSDDLPGISYREYADYLASGGKKSKKSMKGGSDDMPGFSSDKEYALYDAAGGKKSKKSKSVSLKSKSASSKSKSMSKSKKSMSGGMESSGATSLPMRFYNPDIPLDNYPELSGNGSMSAYGAIESGDIGTGMLAPYTASTCQTANPSSGMKTGGGSKKIKRSLRGGTKIPYISDSPVSSIQNGVDGAINGFSGFMAQLDADYLKSVAYVKSIKIGNQRLIQGGSKKKKSSKTEKKEKKGKKQKKIIKKPMSKKMSMKKGGSNGSDFALTLNSRGPVNAPDNYWGVPGEVWFRQFNKTGDYIPNSKLPYAATPLLAGQNESGVVSGYDESTLAYPSV